MMITLLVTYRIKPGEEAAVEAAVGEMIRLTRAEPGCVTYTALRSEEDPRKLVLYEQYRDEAALAAHAASEYFQRIVLGTIVPKLESRVREPFTVLG